MNRIENIRQKYLRDTIMGVKVRFSTGGITSGVFALF